jgi:hypothetical protein
VRVFRRSIVRAKLIAAVWVISGATISAYGASVTFDFNNLSNGDGNATIQSKMNLLLGAGQSVTVGSGAVADNSYTGDGHVVGPKVGGVYVPLTLANTNGAVSSALPATPNGSLDTFLRNVGGESSPNDRITMIFSGLTISSVSFDYEIFPDGSCPVAGCSTYPDFTFGTTDPTTHVFTSIFTKSAVDVSTTNTTYTNSPCGSAGASLTNPCVPGTETAPQYLGTSGVISVGGATELDFIDWPATIGIDNLVINFSSSSTPAPVPEPGSLVLLGTVASALFVMKRKMGKA